jgi:hypothetical protein
MQMLRRKPSIIRLANALTVVTASATAIRDVVADVADATQLQGNQGNASLRRSSANVVVGDSVVHVSSDGEIKPKRRLDGEDDDDDDVEEEEGGKFLDDPFSCVDFLLGNCKPKDHSHPMTEQHVEHLIEAHEYMTADGVADKVDKTVEEKVEKKLGHSKFATKEQVEAIEKKTKAKNEKFQSEIGGMITAEIAKNVPGYQTADDVTAAITSNGVFTLDSESELNKKVEMRPGADIQMHIPAPSLLSDGEQFMPSTQNASGSVRNGLVRAGANPAGQPTRSLMKNVRDFTKHASKVKDIVEAVLSRSPVDNGPPDLVISKVQMDASADIKYLQFYNPTSADISMCDASKDTYDAGKYYYKYEIYAVAGTVNIQESWDIDLCGFVAAGATFTLCTGQASDYSGDAACDAFMYGGEGGAYRMDQLMSLIAGITSPDHFTLVISKQQHTSLPSFTVDMITGGASDNTADEARYASVAKLRTVKRQEVCYVMPQMSYTGIEPTDKFYEYSQMATKEYCSKDIDGIADLMELVQAQFAVSYMEAVDYQGVSYGRLTNSNNHFGPNRQLTEGFNIFSSLCSRLGQAANVHNGMLMAGGQSLVSPMSAESISNELIAATRSCSTYAGNIAEMVGDEKFDFIRSTSESGYHAFDNAYSEVHFNPYDIWVQYNNYHPPAASSEDNFAYYELMDTMVPEDIRKLPILYERGVRKLVQVVDRAVEGVADRETEPASSTTQKCCTT